MTPASIGTKFNRKTILPVVEQVVTLPSNSPTFKQSSSFFQANVHFRSLDRLHDTQGLANAVNLWRRRLRFLLGAVASYFEIKSFECQGHKHQDLSLCEKGSGKGVEPFTKWQKAGAVV